MYLAYGILSSPGENKLLSGEVDQLEAPLPPSSESELSALSRWENISCRLRKIISCQ